MSEYGLLLQRSLSNLKKSRKSVKIESDLCRMCVSKVTREISRVEKVILLGTVENKQWTEIAKEVESLKSAKGKYSKQRIHGIREACLDRLSFDPFEQLRSNPDEFDELEPSEDDLMMIENER